MVDDNAPGLVTQKCIDSAQQHQVVFGPPLTINNEEPLRVGEHVLARNFTLSNAAEEYIAQLAPQWAGPFTGLERCSGDVFVFERRGRENIKLHVNALKRVPQQPSAEAADTAQQPINMPHETVPLPQLLTTSSSRTASATATTRIQSPSVDKRAAEADLLPQALPVLLLLTKTCFLKLITPKS